MFELGTPHENYISIIFTAGADAAAAAEVAAIGLTLRFVSKPLFLFSFEETCISVLRPFFRGFAWCR